MKRICKQDECSREVWARGYCGSHYTQWRNTFAPECSFEGCIKGSRANGLCSGHYAQQRDGKQLTPLRKKRKQRSSLERDADGNKECQECLRWKHEESFAPAAKSADGLLVTCRECNLIRAQLARYGLTPEGLESLLSGQNYSCASCGDEFEVNETGRYKFHADHDHSCCPGEKTCGNCIRALLCAWCNSAAGHLKDSPVRAMAMYEYLTKHAKV